MFAVTKRAYDRLGLALATALIIGGGFMGRAQAAPSAAIKMVVSEVDSRAAAVQLWFGLGGAPTNLAHLVEHLLVDESNRQSDSPVGGRTTHDALILEALVSPREVGAVVTAMAGAASRPMISSERVAAEKRVLALEAVSHRLDPGRQDLQAAAARLFAAHRYSEPVDGPERAIGRLSRAQVFDFFQEIVHAGNALLVVVGDVDGPAIRAAGAEAFAHLQPGSAPAPIAAPEEGGPIDLGESGIGWVRRGLQGEMALRTLADAVAGLAIRARVQSHVQAAALTVSGAEVGELQARARALLPEDLLSSARRTLARRQLRAASADGRARDLAMAELRGEEPAPTEPAEMARAAARIVGAPFPAAIPSPTTRRAPRHRARAGKVVELTTRAGATILIDSRPRAAGVAVRAAWAGGLTLESDDEAGLHHLMASTIMAGCDQRSSAQLARKLAATGGSMQGVAGRHSFGLVGHWPESGAVKGLELLADCLLAPRFEHVVVEARKRQLLARLRRTSSDDGVRAHRSALSNLFPGHPLGRHLAGRPTTLDGIASRTLRSRYRSLYPSGRLVVAVVGDIEAARVAAWARRHFGETASVPNQPARAAPKPPRTGQHFASTDEDEAHVVVAWRTEGFGGKHRLALEIIAELLERPGGGLYQDLRSSGLAYHLGAAAVPGPQAGYLAVHAEAGHADVGKTVEVIRDQLEELRTSGPDAAALASARKALIARHLAARDSIVRSAAGLALHEAYGLGHRQFVDYPSALRKVSQSQVKSAAQAYLTWNRAVIDTVAQMPLSPAAERRARGRRKRPRRGKR